MIHFRNHIVKSFDVVTFTCIVRMKSLCVPWQYCTATKHPIDHITCINRCPSKFLSIPFNYEKAIDLYLCGRSMVQPTEGLKASVAARRWRRVWRWGAHESWLAAAVAAVRAGATARGSQHAPSMRCLASSPAIVGRPSMKVPTYF